MFSPSQYVLSNASFEIRRKYDLEISKDSLIDHVKIFLLAREEEEGKGQHPSSRSLPSFQGGRNRSSESAERFVYNNKNQRGGKSRGEWSRQFIFLLIQRKISKGENPSLKSIDPRN